MSSTRTNMRSWLAAAAIGLAGMTGVVLADGEVKLANGDIISWEDFVGGINNPSTMKPVETLPESNPAMVALAAANKRVEDAEAKKTEEEGKIEGLTTALTNAENDTVAKHNALYGYGDTPQAEGYVEGAKRALAAAQEAMKTAQAESDQQKALTDAETAVTEAQEKLNTTLPAELSRLQTQQTNLNSQRAAAHQELLRAETNLANAKTAVSTAEQAVTTAEGKVTTAEGAVTNLESKLSTLETQLNGLKSTEKITAPWLQKMYKAADAFLHDNTGTIYCCIVGYKLGTSSYRKRLLLAFGDKPAPVSSVTADGTTTVNWESYTFDEYVDYIEGLVATWPNQCGVYYGSQYKAIMGGSAEYETISSPNKDFEELLTAAVEKITALTRSSDFKVDDPDAGYTDPTKAKQIQDQIDAINDETKNEDGTYKTGSLAAAKAAVETAKAAVTTAEAAVETAKGNVTTAQTAVDKAQTAQDNIDAQLNGGTITNADGTKEEVEGVTTQINNTQSQINTLNGDASTEGSIKNLQAAVVTAQTALDTWVSEYTAENITPKETAVTTAETNLAQSITAYNTAKKNYDDGSQAVKDADAELTAANEAVTKAEADVAAAKVTAAAPTTPTSLSPQM